MSVDVEHQAFRPAYPKLVGREASMFSSSASLVPGCSGPFSLVSQKSRTEHRADSIVRLRVNLMRANYWRAMCVGHFFTDPVSTSASFCEELAVLKGLDLKDFDIRVLAGAPRGEGCGWTPWGLAAGGEHNTGAVGSTGTGGSSARSSRTSVALVSNSFLLLLVRHLLLLAWHLLLLAGTCGRFFQ